jgi:hypothetical protein
MINRQEILNKVYPFIMKQNQKCMKPGNGNYQYHYQELRCNVGVIIPIEEYIPEFENYNLEPEFQSEYQDLLYPIESDNSIVIYFKSKGFEEDDLYWLWRLQNIHDDYEVEEWKTQFKYFASIYDLTLPPERPEGYIGPKILEPQYHVVYSDEYVGPESEETIQDNEIPDW